MTEGETRAVSLRQRLLNKARAEGEEFQRLLTRYAIERLLYRLGRSDYKDRFVLKGALLFFVWTARPHRSTRDLDLLGSGEQSVEALVAVFGHLCRVPAEEDGLDFDANTVTAREIREQSEYGGIRVTLTASLAGARIPLQVDVGFGDAVTPPAKEVNYPTLLDLPAPRVQAYSPETVVAEKLEALVTLGMDNSRMKDFYDLWALSHECAMEQAVLAAAVRATFARRRTPVPQEVPVALTDTFATDPAKQVQWTAFVRRSLAPTEPAPTLADLILHLNLFLMPLLTKARL